MMPILASEALLCEKLDWYPDEGTVSAAELSRTIIFPNFVSKSQNCKKSDIFWMLGGGGYFGNLTLNTESKSAIFEFSRGGGGYFGNLTWVTSDLKSLTFHFQGGGGFFGVNSKVGVFWRFWKKKCTTGKSCWIKDSLTFQYHYVTPVSIKHLDL